LGWYNTNENFLRKLEGFNVLSLIIHMRFCAILRHNKGVSAAAYRLYFTDSNGKQISDVQKIIADKTSDNSQDRIFRCSFNLKSLKYSNTENYYLVIADETGFLFGTKLRKVKYKKFLFYF
jgi:hypothetical protein